MEPQAQLTYDGASGSDVSARGFLGIELRQGESNTAICPKVQIDALRVATNWADLFDAAEVVAPTISVNPGYWGRDNAENGVALDGKFIVSAENVTGDVTITCGKDVTADKTTLTPEEVKGDGAVVNFTITPNVAESGKWESSITFSSEGAESVVIPLTIDYVMKLDEFTNPADLNTFYKENGAYSTFYRFTGKAVVSYVRKVEEKWSSYDLIYAQDAEGNAFCLNTSYADGVTIKAGDEITDLVGMIGDEDATGIQFMLSALSEGASVYKVTAENQTVTPAEVDVNNFDAAANQYRLMTLPNVQFSTAGNFEDASYSVTASEKTALVHPFAASDIIGTAIPTDPVDVTGICMSKNALVIWPRSLSDIVPAHESKVELTPAEDGTYTVYSLQGVRLMNTKDASMLNNLTPGIYVINGRKVIIRK